MQFIFNRNTLSMKPGNEYITQEEIKNSSGLFRASLQDAVNYGGEAIQKALSSVPLKYDKQYITVDAKVHMLMPGMIPAIPGWHTDGIPRNYDGGPSGDYAPFCPTLDLYNSPNFHLFIAGDCSPTQFIANRNLSLEVPDSPTHDLYAIINENAKLIESSSLINNFDIAEGVWYSWDWFELHKAQAARKRGWRLLIRVTESDHLQPNTNLREILRTQQQVYLAGESFGW